MSLYNVIYIFVFFFLGIPYQFSVRAVTFVGESESNLSAAIVPNFPPLTTFRAPQTSPPSLFSRYYCGNSNCQKYASSKYVCGPGNQVFACTTHNLDSLFFCSTQCLVRSHGLVS